MNGRGVPVRTREDLAHEAWKSARKRGEFTVAQVAKDATLTEGGALAIVRRMVEAGAVTKTVGTVGNGPYGAVYEVTRGRRT